MHKFFNGKYKKPRSEISDFSKETDHLDEALWIKLQCIQPNSRRSGMLVCKACDTLDIVS